VSAPGLWSAKEAALANAALGCRVWESGRPGIFCFNSNNTTMFKAHKHVKKNFDSLVSGDVIDVEFIQGKSKSSKVSEIEKE